MHGERFPRAGGVDRQQAIGFDEERKHLDFRLASCYAIHGKRE